MLDLRTLDPARQTADRRVVLAYAYGLLGAFVFFAVVAGADARFLVSAVILALAGVPWCFAFTGRWRLLDDALRGVPFVWRGERAGVWGTAPIAGALLGLLAGAWPGLPAFLGVLVCFLAAGAYTALIVWVERRYERLILLDLTVLETRFQRITRVNPQARMIAASQLSAEARRGVGAADGDLEVQVRPRREPRRPDASDGTAHPD